MGNVKKEIAARPLSNEGCHDAGRSRAKAPASCCAFINGRVLLPAPFSIDIFRVEARKICQARSL